MATMKPIEIVERIGHLSQVRSWGALTVAWDRPSTYWFSKYYCVKSDMVSGHRVASVHQEFPWNRGQLVYEEISGGVTLSIEGHIKGNSLLNAWLPDPMAAFRSNNETVVQLEGNLYGPDGSMTLKFLLTETSDGMDIELLRGRVVRSCVDTMLRRVTNALLGYGNGNWGQCSKCDDGEHYSEHVATHPWHSLVPEDVIEQIKADEAIVLPPGHFTDRDAMMRRFATRHIKPLLEQTLTPPLQPLEVAA